MCRSAVNDGSCSPWVMCSCSVVRGNPPPPGAASGADFASSWDGAASGADSPIPTVKGEPLSCSAISI